MVRKSPALRTMLCLLSPLLLFLLVAISTASSTKKSHGPSSFFTIESRSLMGLGLGHQFDTTDGSDSSDKYVDQLIDHFNTTNAATFQQRYYVNTAYTNNKGLHILFVGWESPLPSGIVKLESLPMVKLAKSLKATMWGLEHRCYGKSRACGSSMSLDNLALLTSEQAVEDIADFIRAQNKASGESSPKWVLFGGSYSGNLVLWFRQKYPGLSLGVVSSSAPIQPSLDFYSFQQNVDEAYAAFSPQCHDQIEFSLTDLRKALQNEQGRARLSKDLKLQPSFDKLRLNYKDFQFFHYNIAQLFRLPVMFNKVNRPPFSDGYGIADVCKIMTDANNGDHIGKITALANYLLPVFTTSSLASLNNNYTGLVELLRQEAYDDDTGEQRATMRAWIWQVCNEFGWAMTTDYGRGLFGSALPNNFFIDVCADVFGDNYGGEFYVDRIKAAIKKTAGYYQSSATYTGTNAVIIVGAADPFRSLAVNDTTDTSGNSLVYWADGMAHVADLLPASSDDTYGLKFARSSTISRVKKWISGSKAVKETVNEAEKTQTRPKQAQAKAEKPFVERWRPERTDFKSELVLLSNASEHPMMRANLKLRKGHQSEHLFSRLSHGKYMSAKLKHLHASDGKDQISQLLQEKYYAMGYVYQPLDHFDDTIDDRFKQYFISNNKYMSDDGPIFLMLGGESPIEWFLVSDYVVMMAWAKHFNATAYTLEHRFYGFSQPKEDVSDPYLEWLTTEQALADAANFIRTINAQYNYTGRPWVVFGGSYPGNLAAWFRLKYPDLVVGAVASSAPVQAKTDFFEYMQTVQNSTERFGGAKCARTIKKYYNWMQHQMTTKAGRMRLSKDFWLCDKWDEESVDEKDLEMFLGVFTWFISGFVQYDDEDHDYVEYVCEMFEDLDDYYDTNNVVNINAKAKALPFAEEKYHEVSQRLGRAMHDFAKNGWEGLHAPTDYATDYTESTSTESSSGTGRLECQDWSYDSYIEYLQQDQYILDYGGYQYYLDTSYRCWTYQACTEWGYQQSTNMGYNLFESALPVNFGIDSCTDAFGDLFNRRRMDAGVDATNYCYGGQDNFNGTNVVFVNGSEDPWHQLSLYDDHVPLNADSVTTILIEGGSHCEDMWHSTYADNQKLINARKRIRTIIAKWLKQYKGQGAN